MGNGLIEIHLVPEALPKLESIVDDWLSGEIKKLVDAYNEACRSKAYGEQEAAKGVLVDSLKALLMGNMPAALVELKSKLSKIAPADPPELEPGT